MNSAGFCFCKDAPDIKVDTRDQVLKEVMDLCLEGKMDRCLCRDCRDNTKIVWPFTQLDVINCSPKKIISVP